MSRGGPFRRTRRGIVLHLDAGIRALLLRLLGELDGLLAGSADGDGFAAAGPLARLFPPGVSDDADAEAEYRRLMLEELVTSRRAAIATLTSVLGGDAPLDEADMSALMQTVNALRLVLGSILGITEDEDDDLPEDPEDDPLAGERQIYLLLSWLLDQAVEAVTER